MRTLGQIKNERTGYRMRTQSMYNTAAWRRLRAAYRDQHPVCEECKRQGKTTPMFAVDHIKPHGGNVGLFWDWDNLQSLCRKCHNAKTQREMM